ncbi:MAG: hypothetical protein E7466_07785 [Ruminococcaceae bacterium]|nr:hypothetical protein [Oscillospiraceae bacterium]
MSKRKLVLIWYSLLLVCAIMGFIPEPDGLLKFLCVALSITPFIPAGLLLKWAKDRKDHRTIRQVRNISIISLSVTMVLFCLNVVSVLMSELWGTIFYVLLVIGSTPMICAQYWVIGLFGWACLMWSAITLLPRKKKS